MINSKLSAYGRATRYHISYTSYFCPPASPPLTPPPPSLNRRAALLPPLTPPPPSLKRRAALAIRHQTILRQRRGHFAARAICRKIATSNPTPALPQTAGASRRCAAHVCAGNGRALRSPPVFHRKLHHEPHHHPPSNAGRLRPSGIRSRYRGVPPRAPEPPKRWVCRKRHTHLFGVLE